MICERPFTKDGLAFPCGGCLTCRYQRSRVWAHRIQLEATQHEHNAFITLTYNEEANARRNGNLRPRDVTLFLKKLRKAGHKFRYYYVGEYGPQTLRPHYHLAMFGFRTCDRGQTDLKKRYCCPRCDIVNGAWSENGQQLGACQLARLEPHSAAYVAGYVTKKLLSKPIPNTLEPEFQRMSLRPGLGYGVMHDVASVLLKHHADIEDVPVALSHGTKPQPLGRYLRRNLRKMMGRDEKCPETVMEKIRQELSPLREAAFNNSTSLQKEVVAKNQTRRLSFLQLKKIRQSGKTL